MRRTRRRWWTNSNGEASPPTRFNPTDRRSKMISLTEEGRKAVAHAGAITADPPDAFRGLAADDLVHLERIVSELGGFGPD